jgi:hypothetical protein
MDRVTITIVTFFKATFQFFFVSISELKKIYDLNITSFSLTLGRDASSYVGGVGPQGYRGSGSMESDRRGD